MAGDGRSNGMGPPSQKVAQREIGFLSSATTSCGRLKSEFVGCQGTAVPSQPGNCTRDRTLEGAEVGAGVVVDVRLPRSCHRRSEARVGEGPDCFQETTNRCRSRTMPQVHHKVREEGGRVGCGTFSRIQCSSRSERSPTTYGGRTSSSNEPPGTIHTFVSTSRVCRDCCIAKLAEVEGERDAAIRNQSNKRPATMSSVASASADQPMPVTRVPRELSEWLQACHEELGQALAAGDETRVMELSSAKMSVDGGHGAVRSWPLGRMVRAWGYRGVRVGEASHPGPRLLRAPTVVDSDEEPLLRARRTFAVSQPTHGLAVADSGTRHSARLLGVRADHRRGLVVEVAPGVVDATAVDLMTIWQMVPAFNFMDSDEEDEFDRTVAESRPIEDVPRPSPDEEFLDLFQQDLMRTCRRVRRRFKTQSAMPQKLEVVASRGEWC